jgi:hypothetical protein
MTNKELINLLSGYPMKSEVEVLDGERRLLVEKVTRHFIPEKTDADGRKVPARNLVQLVLQEK